MFQDCGTGLFPLTRRFKQNYIKVLLIYFEQETEQENESTDNNYDVLASLDLSAAFYLVNRNLLFKRMEFMN